MIKVKSIFLLIAGVFAMGTTMANTKKQVTKSPMDYVDPFIGTGGIVHTFPGATMPNGMIQLSPDGDTQGWNWCSGYHYSDTNLKGFSHTHLSGTGWSDLGDILLMPTVGKIQTEPGTKEHPDAGWRSRFSHDQEQASPGYYEVFLKDYDVDVALTAGRRVGYHQYHFPKTTEANVVIDPTNKIFGSIIETKVTQEDEHTVSGYCYSNGWGGKRYTYFVAKFSKPMTGFMVSSGKDLARATSREGKSARGFAIFNTEDDQQLEVRVAISAVSLEGAKANLASEVTDFSTALKQAKSSWAEKLNAFEVSGGTEAQKRIFYTGIYHNYIAPNLTSDVDGKYIVNEKVYQAKGFENYSSFSFWDTFRATQPLLHMVSPELSSNVMQSLIARHRDAKSHLPLWELCGVDNTCMIGYPTVAVLYDAIMKGVPGIDEEEAFEAMKDIANTNKDSSSDGVGGLDEYISLGYVPADIPKNVSKTLEYAYEDWCIASLAKRLGKMEDYRVFKARSENYRNLFNSDRKMFWPKNADGSWFGEINQHKWDELQQHWISGNLWAYEYFAPHAVNDLIELKGGVKDFTAQLDDLFSKSLDMEGEEHVDISGFIGGYAHGDEPGHANAYLYNYVGQPYKTQALVRQIMDEMYTDQPDGMPNNEDCGQMSAWYVFSSMGFYPACPGDEEFLIGSPLFSAAKMKLGNGNVFTMEAKNQSAENIYVQSIEINGKKVNRTYITQQEIMNGGSLKLVMGNKPNTKLGAKSKFRPTAPASR
ncbi:GH92 family glycosyl hydrolase [Persicobacter psychrovividus]|uniref:Alpha-1,2-mannosidase n=1 Tax=Persicobacter psychrovividus TaxID=387638 RepID=A0ABM7VMM3_9BACT|nr:hypothetical protein PEPS_45010 [Persicobacter psychrovividus]